ncbi:hypothetical protein U4960_03140 [Altererythrobacter sp. H2]|uniref:hypothetical protein n=1 Tax=Altererythrobacter sp. H2 TaxID=3108391 RepID=UPI002B4BA6C1|nr:hypothetical protein [Altererythrobacter sp. H2]WRK96344.1 hypothetical protein U4960_03140 [Altererythrobacter sp. H2]
MADKKHARGDWEEAFLAGLRDGEGPVAAARRLNISRSTPHARRKTHPAFALQWDEAVASAGRPVRRKVAAPADDWQAPFLAALAETSNVSAAASRAGVQPGKAYALRREDRAFAERWLAALLEGYEHLEMEVLGYLRDPDPPRKMDVANALRLLAAHRDTVARERASQGEEDEQAVLDSIDALIDEMRQRSLAGRDETGNDQTDGEHQPG